MRATRQPAVTSLPGLASMSSSIHSPRYGWMVPVKTVLASRPGWKMTPGERTSCDTTTRSVPLTMKVPRSVIIGKSPMKTVCSLISPVVALRKRARTKTGAAYVMSFSLHSSTENFGGGRRSASVGSNSSSRLSWPVKSSIGLMSW